MFPAMRRPGKTRSPSRLRFSYCLWLSGNLLVAACAQDPNGAYGVLGTGGAGGSGGSPEPDGPIQPVGPSMVGLHVVGNHIQNSDGISVSLRGVNRSGSEYQCAKAAGFFDGPVTSASVRAMVDWKINAVRIPLNEACWLGINGVTEDFGGDNYRQAILAYVALLHQAHIVPLLDLHWVGPGTSAADRLQPMPDADHATVFWADVANTFAADDGVVFEMFNEPFPDHNRDSDAGWLCWRDGCVANQSVPVGKPPLTYQAVGMQGLVNAVRATGSKHLLLLGGLQYSNALSQWMQYMPSDPAANLGAAWHVYNFNGCANAGCWNTAPAALALALPVVVTELGENDCGGTFVDSLLQWGDSHGVGYLAWTWNTWGQCLPPTPPATQGGRPWALIGDYLTADPISGYAQTYRDHLLAF